MKMETRSIKVMTIKGKPVMDGVAPKTLVITPDDIAHAKRHSASACAAAVAIRRQFKLKGARVYLNRTYMEQENIWVRYVTPHALRDEIISFDRSYEGWTGGEYVMRPPPVSQRQGATHHKVKDPNGVVKHRPHKLTDVRRAARGTID